MLGDVLGVKNVVGGEDELQAVDLFPILFHILFFSLSCFSGSCALYKG